MPKAPKAQSAPLESPFGTCLRQNSSMRNFLIGVTSDLERRTWDHKHDVFKGFTKRYKVHLLVYYEDSGDAFNAIQREKQVKKWNRAWKIRLIEKHNPNWKDLYDEQRGILPLPRE